MITVNEISSGDIVLVFEDSENVRFTKNNLKAGNRGYGSIRSSTHEIFRDVPSEDISGDFQQETPSEVTNYQARAAFLDAGELTQVETFVNSSGDDLTKEAWNHAPMFTRDSPLIAAIEADLGLTSAEMDTRFKFAVLVT